MIFTDIVPGNPWIICTLWQAQYLIEKARTLDELNEAIPLLEWTVRHAAPSGVLAEQINPYTAEHMSVSPLTWSHATYIIVVMEYLKKLQALPSFNRRMSELTTPMRTPFIMPPDVYTVPGVAG